MKVLRVGLGVMAMVLFVHQGFGATLCAVTNPLDTNCGDGSCSLQAALDVAATNSADDVIRIVRGTHVSDAFDGFSYDSYQGDDLRLEGGFNASCSSQALDPTNTVIEGLADGGRLTLKNHTGGDVHVEGVTIQGSNWWNLHGLDVVTKVRARTSRSTRTSSATTRTVSTLSQPTTPMPPS